MIAAIIVSMLAGATVVLSRTFNARLAAATSDFVATLANYVTGLAGCGVVLLVMWRNAPAPARANPPLWVFLGGVIGVVVVTLMNVTTVKISAFYMTLLTFIGQVFAGVIIDILITGSFSWQNLAGGSLVSAGLIFNLVVERREAKGARGGTGD